jgi:chromate transporter
MPSSVESVPYSNGGLLLYFLRLGTTGFGGPVALASRMHEDLVVHLNWISEEEYREGLTLAQLAPGPLAAQLAIYLGWVRGRTKLASLVAFAFILPSFLIVLAIGEIYIRMNGLPVMQSIFYGVGASVIAIIAMSAWKLSAKTLKRDFTLWGIASISTVFTLATGTEALWIFLAGGILYMLIKRQYSKKYSLKAFIPTTLITGIHGPADSSMLKDLFIYFAKAGTLVFGSGLAIVPFLHGGVVDRFHWLSEREFIDAVAVAMITPGPVVITVAFIGYLLAGFSGAVASALGVFLPCYLLVVVPAPYFKKITEKAGVRHFIDGVTAAAVGAIIGAVGVLGTRAIYDLWTTLIAAISLLLLIRTKKVPEPILLILAGILGVFLHTR